MQFLTIDYRDDKVDNMIDPIPELTKEFDKLNNNNPFIIGVFGNSRRLNYKFNVVFNENREELESELDHSLSFQYRHLMLTNVTKALTIQEFLMSADNYGEGNKFISVETVSPTRPICLFTNESYDKTKELINDLVNFFSQPDSEHLIRSDVENIFISNHTGNYIFIHKNHIYTSHTFETIKVNQNIKLLKLKGE